MSNNTIIPSYIQIETVSGLCNSRCLMCPIKYTKQKQIMDNATFIKILNKLLPYLNNQEFLSFCGLGETLFDKEVDEKIRIAKLLGFRGVGLYTNGMLLSEEISKKLLDACLDTLIVSIDGFTSKTQESIRVGTNLSKIISNVEQFIALREMSISKTKIIIRFHRQILNKHEENDYLNFWRQKIKNIYNDSIHIYNVHNVGGWSKNFSDKLILNMQNAVKKLKCPQVYERLMINSDGSLSFCCGVLFGRYHIGNVLVDDPIKLYNSSEYILYRQFMENGKILELEVCKNCSVLFSIVNKEIHKKNIGF